MSTAMTSTDHETFELLVGLKTANGYQVAVTQAPAGIDSALCQLDPSDYDLRDSLAKVESGSQDAELLARLGGYLFDALFTGGVGALYRSSVGIARAQGKRLSVRLRLELPELAALPWEYLYDPAEELPLAISPEICLLRNVPMQSPARPTRVDLPLRVLAVISNPSDVEPLDVDRERCIIQDALAEAGEQGRVRLEFAPRAAGAEISQAIRRFKPHVFHFVGHGAFRHDTAYVVLEDDEGRAQLMDDTTFREFFLGADQTRLAVLNACQTAAVSSSKPLAGLAPGLLRRQLAAVVGMQYPIGDRAALAFTREFYRSLVLHGAVDVAVSEARRGVYIELGRGTRDWGAPVLYLCASDGRLFDIPEVSVLPAPERPPMAPAFVGRQAELARLSQKLTTEHLLVVTGMAGVGKTAFAAHLARQNMVDDRIFWHSFREGQDVDVVIRSLAGFLARHGQDDLWRGLESVRLNGGRTPPPEESINQLVHLLHGKSYLLCLDDYQYVAGDSLCHRLVSRLASLATDEQLLLVVASREDVDFASSEILQGLEPEEVRRLLARHDLQLDDNLVAELHRQTEGNAELLVLAINALRRRSQPPAQLIAQLAEVSDVKGYLIRQVHAGLTEGEQEAMNAAAILMGYSGTADAIEAITGGKSVGLILWGLAARHLLHVRQSVQGSEYDQHAIVRTFYYNLLSKSHRRELHQRAGQYYLKEEPEPLRAAEHFERAGDYAQAAELATGDIWALINRGQAAALRRLLERFTASQLSPELWARVTIARGEMLQYSRESGAARAQYRQALELLGLLPDSAAVRSQKAHVYRRLGELLTIENPREGIEWIRHGLEVAPEEDADEKAALYIQRGALEKSVGQFDAALASIRQGLDLTQGQANQLRIDALTNLATIHSERGDAQQARQCIEQGIALSRRLDDLHRLVKLYVNLSIEKDIGGDWPGAIAAMQDALALAQRVGSTTQHAQIALNLGYMQFRRGDYQEAARQLAASLDLAQAGDLRRLEVAARTNLAHLWLAQDQLSATQDQLWAAERIAAEIDAPDAFPEILFLRAQVALVLGQAEVARLDAEQARQKAQALGMQIEEGIALRVLGQAYLAQGCQKDAWECFKQSMDRSSPEPYESARTQVAWGRAMRNHGDVDQAAALLAQARATFERLGAQRDLASIKADCLDQPGR